MNVWDAIEARRSYRVFKKDPVSKNLIKKILTAGGQAPSSCICSHGNLLWFPDENGTI